MLKDGGGCEANSAIFTGKCFNIQCFISPLRSFKSRPIQYKIDKGTIKLILVESESAEFCMPEDLLVDHTVVASSLVEEFTFVCTRC